MKNISHNSQGFVSFSKILVLALMITAPVFTYAQNIDWNTIDFKKLSPEEAERINQQIERRLAKSLGDPRAIKSFIMHGNKITTVVYNYGSICRPNTLSQTADLVWNGLGYGFEFTPLVAAEVTDTAGNKVHILDDGMWLQSQGGYAPDGSLKWGWLPKPGYADPNQNDIAHWSDRASVGGDLTRKPPSWPESWYNPILGRYVWPAYLGSDATTPDEEVYFVTDDYTNRKYAYFPFPNDSTKRGLGLDLACRFFQFNNPLAENIIFLVYTVTNQSPKSISRVYFGMYGDPHVGGYTDYNDDLAFFIPPRGPLADPYPQRARSMVYAWDSDSRGIGGKRPGYFGYKFLESPTNSWDGIDNDDDGIIDESPFNDAGHYIDGISHPLTEGISDTAKYKRMYGDPKPRWSGDENGNWDPEKDDVGLDGIPGTHDEGEGNGKPDIVSDPNDPRYGLAEPNFGFRDVNESDQIGLTSFWALPYTNSLPNVPKNDALFWQLMSADSIDINQTLFNTPGDNVFLYASGPFTLAQYAKQRFSIALLMGQNLPDLLLNAETAQRVLEANYRFAQPPPKPIVTVVPGNGRVTLYWDDAAENAVDPLTNERDFEGYKIYRSEDYTFSDVYTITDGHGVPFLGQAMVDKGTGKPAQWHKVWNDSLRALYQNGFHPVEYPGRGVKYWLGDPQDSSGLRHVFVDSSVTNGKTYYYAVVSYDHGFIKEGTMLPPTECQAVISKDPITQKLTFDVNTAMAIPGASPAGYIPPTIDNGQLPVHIRGAATGDVSIKILNEQAVKDGKTYDILFSKSGTSLFYNVKDTTGITTTIVSRDTVYSSLGYKNLVGSSIIVKDAAGNIIDPSRYSIDTVSGQIRSRTAGDLPSGAVYNVSFQYYPVYKSTRFNSEDDNPAFDGMKLFVQDVQLAFDTVHTGWRTRGNTNVVARFGAPQTGTFTLAPLDIEISFNATDTASDGSWLSPGDTAYSIAMRKEIITPFHIRDVTRNLPVDFLVVENPPANKRWSLGERIVVLTPPPYKKTATSTDVQVVFLPPPPDTIKISRDTTINGRDTTIVRDSLVAKRIILPTQGDVYHVAVSKPFADGDEYLFTTHAAKIDNALASSQLNNIYVVPNPYVVFSSMEQPGVTSDKRGEQVLEFRNLPPKCTIRIYTITGELVKTIEKDDMTNYARWDLLSYEAQRLAYGVYIYHVDAPGIGQKIGRFALIK